MRTHLRCKVLVLNNNRLMRPPSERARSRLGLCPAQTIRRLQTVSLEVLLQRKGRVRGGWVTKGNSDELRELRDPETPLDWLLAWEVVGAHSQS